MEIINKSSNVEFGGNYMEFKTTDLKIADWFIDIGKQINNDLCDNCLKHKCEDSKIWCDNYENELSKRLKEYKEKTQ